MNHNEKICASCPNKLCPLRKCSVGIRLLLCDKLQQADLDYQIQESRRKIAENERLIKESERRLERAMAAQIQKLSINAALLKSLSFIQSN